MTTKTPIRAALVVPGGLVAVAVLSKGLGTQTSPAGAAGRAGSAVRVGGWCMSLSGLAYAALWALALLPLADTLSMAVVMLAILVTFTYGAWALRLHQLLG